MVLGTLFGLAVAIVLSQDFLPPKWEWVVKNVVQLLAAIPSVVFGLWGLFVVIPLFRPIANWVHDVLGWIPIFSTRLSGPGLFPTALVLAIMILPTISAISRDAMVAVPNRLREAAFGMGATRWQAILLVVFPTAAPGIFGAIILGFGRAVGETMAVAMLIGNAEVFNWSLFSPARPWRPCWPIILPSRPGRDRGADVCGLGAPGDHPGDQYHRRIHAASSIRGPGRAPKMSSSGPVTLPIPEPGSDRSLA